MSTVTEFGCIPVSTVYHTDQFGWVVTRLVHIKFSTVKKKKKITLLSRKDNQIYLQPSHRYVTVFLFSSFFNNVIGISDPSQLNPPDFCTNSEMKADSEEEPVDFLSLFLNKH